MGNRHLIGKTTLEGYFDESGTHDGSHCLTVAGYLARPEDWARFDEDWNTALAAWGLDYFHMRDFAHRRRAFADWTEDSRRRCLRRLAQIIRANSVMSAGVSVPTSFHSAFTPRARRLVAAPYGFATMALIRLIAQELEKVGVPLDVDYILEDGAVGRGEILAAFSSLPVAPGSRRAMYARSVRFEDKRRAVPLQAADMLAYELYKDFPNQMSGASGKRPLQRAPFRMLQTGADFWRFYRPHDLEEFGALVDRLADERERASGEVGPLERSLDS